MGDVVAEHASSLQDLEINACQLLPETCLRCPVAKVRGSAAAQDLRLTLIPHLLLSTHLFQASFSIDILLAHISPTLYISYCPHSSIREIYSGGRRERRKLCRITSSACQPPSPRPTRRSLVSRPPALRSGKGSCRHRSIW